MSTVRTAENERAPLGARYLGSRRCRFSLWAPHRRSVELKLVHPFEKLVPLDRDAEGVWRAVVESVEPGSKYLFRLDGALEVPDPASRFQPDGVHGPSQVFAEEFSWSSGFWCGLPLQDLVIYEVHTGTFTREGTLDAAQKELPRLKALGATAVELMPVAQFPGSRNWGYDGVFPYAVQNSYGGPAALKRFTDRCHSLGLAVILDVVHNHLGPEGCRLAEIGPYFKSGSPTPWGPALNFDGPDSDGVRRFFIDSALQWVDEFRIDALRLDAVHTIADNSAETFLEELGTALHSLGRGGGRIVYAIAETTRNHPGVVRPRELGGTGLDAHWHDDFHHALHSLLTGERNGYFADYGGVAELARAYRGYALDGRYSKYYRRRFGRPAGELPPRKLVVYGQNHDQVGNRPRGERFSRLLSFEAQKLAAGAVLLSPSVPMLFMGEEYGETAPFHFFTDYGDPALTEAARKGRRAEFSAFGWESDFPDPAAEETFEACRVDPGLAEKGRHSKLNDLYKELLRLRRKHPGLKDPGSGTPRATGFLEEKALLLERGNGRAEVLVLLHFGDMPLSAEFPVPEGRWTRLLDSSEVRWGGAAEARSPAELSSEGTAALAMNPKSFAVYERAGAGGAA